MRVADTKNRKQVDFTAIAPGGTQVAVECKYRSKDKLGPEMVDRLAGALTRDPYKRYKGILMTSTDATDGAKAAAEGAGIGLVDLPVLREWISEAAQAWWLLEPGLGGRVRVARLYVLQRSSSGRLEQTAGKMGLPTAVGYGALVRELDDFYQGELGLVPMLSSKGNWIGCESQMPFDYTTRVKGFMEQIGQDPAAGPYAYYCGASHAELWRIQYSYEEIQRPDGQTIRVPRAPVATVNAAVSVCVDALTYPAARAFALLGRGASSEELHQLRQPVRSALTLR